MARRKHQEVFTVPLELERAWSLMADTQHINQLFFGLNAGQITARDGEKARIKGTFGFLAPEYDEYPWVFEVPTRYKSLRVFVRGLVRRLEVECRLAPTADGTSIDYALNVETIGGPVGAIAAFVVVRRQIAGLAKARSYFASLAAGAKALPSWPPANPQREAVLARAEPVSASIRERAADDVERQALGHIVSFVADAPEPDVARMRPYELADTWGTPRSATLHAFLRAAAGGLLRLSWDLLCPSCEAPTSVRSLKDLPKGGHCPACDVDFTASFEQNVEATFAPEPVIRAAERLVFCHGSPASTKSWLAQFVVEPGQTHELALRLSRGRYRIQGAGLPNATLLDVVDAADAASASEHARVSVERLEGGARLPGEIPPVKAGVVKLAVKNADEKPRRMQLAYRAFASRAATAADVTATGLYRDLFGREALAPDQHVAVGRRAVLFTDLVGSTAMYQRLGDAAAYGLVREHFRLLFEAVEKNNGKVVKTVGDAVMAAFDDPLDGARAARACVVALRGLQQPDGGPSGLKLRVGVHTGPCLAIEANGLVDYFGGTVNLAARVESLGGADEVVLSWTTTASPGVDKFLDEARAAGDAVRDDRCAVKGVEGDVAVTRVSVA